jgi:anti-sigma factor RsiW
MNDDDLSDLLRTHGSRHPASPGLQAAVRTQIALHAATHEKDGVPPQLRSGLRPGSRWQRAMAAMLGVAGGPIRAWQRWPAAAGFASGVVLTAAVVLLGARIEVDETLPRELVVAHVHALQVGPLFEVASSDRHTVKPWFQGRIDYAPTVLDDLRAQGFALLGGRVQAIDGRPTAVMVYQARLHVIDLYVWPSDRGAPPERLHRRGFSLVHWGDGSMQYWAVSDMDAGEVERFAGAWRAVAAAR